MESRKNLKKEEWIITRWGKREVDGVEDGEVEGGLLMLWYMFILQHKNCNLYGKKNVLLSLVFIFIDFFITSYF